MDVRYVWNIKELPETIQDKLKNANPYYSNQLYYYHISKGDKVIYFYDSSEIIIGIIYKIICFKHLTFLSEPYVWGEESEDFLDKIVQLCKSEDFKIDWIDSTKVASLFRTAPKGSIIIPFGSYIIDLEKSEEEIWNNIHGKHKNVIRKAQKDGIIVKIGGKELLDDYVLANDMTCRRSSLNPMTLEKFYQVFDKFDDQVRIFNAYKDDAIQGGAIVIFNKAIGYYQYGASIDHPSTGSMNLIQWNIISFLKKNNCKSYSLVGARINEDKDSKYHGIQEFKKRFGGDLFVGMMFKTVINPYKYKMYRFLKHFYGMEVEDIIDQEIHKWK